MNEAILNDRQVADYLRLLGMDVEETLAADKDKSMLDRLVDAHQTHVPFQTVSINKKGEQPSIGLDDVYEKIVVKGQGGYCFELNKLFEALLRSLGFTVRPIYSRAVRGRDVRMPINHRAMLVMLNGEGASGKEAHRLAYADVGFDVPSVLAVCVYVIVTEIVSVFENLCVLNPELVASPMGKLFSQTPKVEEAWKLAAGNGGERRWLPT